MPRYPRTALPAMLLVLALGLAGCSDLGTKVRFEARGEVSSVALDFGTLQLNDLATRTVTVRNSGNADLTGVATVACPSFAVTAGGGPFTVAPGGSHDVTLSFQPTTQGSYTCTLDLGPHLPAVSLSGTGSFQPAGAAWNVVPPALAFDATMVGETSAKSFEIFSTGMAPLTVDVVAGCGDYVLLSGGGPAVIPPGSSVVVTVSFSPQTGGNRPCSIGLGPGIPSLGATGFATTISFALDIQPIFNSYCISCHPPNNGLNLTTGSSYGNLVNVTSFGYSPAVRVVPNDLANSVLYGKIANTGQFGGRMPQGPFPLPAVLIDMVKTWILEGARNN